jgi:hypothetical protein
MYGTENRRCSCRGGVEAGSFRSGKNESEDKAEGRGGKKPNETVVEIPENNGVDRNGKSEPRKLE